MNILEIKNLTKTYGNNTPVLKDFNLNIPQGKIVGLLGPNGCGKTTLIKLITGLLQPDFGEIKIGNEELSEITNKYISYLPERTYFNSNMMVADIIKYFEDFYEDFDKDRAYKLLQDLNINVNSRLKTHSKGTKEKIQLLLVMSRKTKLYLLDEPIAGVDPAARDYILSTIVSNYENDATIIITTHLIADVEQILDDFIFMNYGGEILLSGNVEETRIESGKSLDQLFREEFRCWRN